MLNKIRQKKGRCENKKSKMQNGKKKQVENWKVADSIQKVHLTYREIHKKCVCALVSECCLHSHVCGLNSFPSASCNLFLSLIFPHCFCRNVLFILPDRDPLWFYCMSLHGRVWHSLFKENLADIYLKSLLSCFGTMQPISSWYTGPICVFLTTVTN